ncbi:hypothetical protein ES703_71416 [subsurface metagenome]
MKPELTAEEAIELLEDLYERIPWWIFIMKASQVKRAQVDAHVDDVVEAVDAQGHPEIRQNSY